MTPNNGGFPGAQPTVAPDGTAATTMQQPPMQQPPVQQPPIQQPSLQYTEKSSVP